MARIHKSPEELDGFRAEQLRSSNVDDVMGLDGVIEALRKTRPDRIEESRRAWERAEDRTIPDRFEPEEEAHASQRSKHETNDMKALDRGELPDVPTDRS